MSDNTSMNNLRRPTWLNYWGWGSGDMLGAGAQAVIIGWLFYFFTSFCGLTAWAAGLILGLPRLLETISCPLIGYVWTIYLQSKYKSGKISIKYETEKLDLDFSSHLVCVERRL